MDPIELSLFAHRMNAVCEEMGAVLRNTAVSPNIRDRLDYSCAVFDADGALCAQAAHIPVHLGSMAYAMRDLVRQFRWRAGDMVIVNDPFLGGTHLPDVTLIAPVLEGTSPAAFVACRAHHADIGCDAPGSMPIATRLDMEGVVLPPQQVLIGSDWTPDFQDTLRTRFRNPAQSEADFKAQKSANLAGAARLGRIIDSLGRQRFAGFVRALADYAERMARDAVQALPDGRFEFEDVLDDDGAGTSDIAIRAALTIAGSEVEVDFTGTAGQVAGNVNCPGSVTAAAVFYVFYCLMPRETPASWGAFRPVRLHLPHGSLLNARRPAAVAAGNVETSTRVVDVLLGALAQAVPDRIPAASCGTMNNVAFGAGDWDYYETIAGGAGASSAAAGVHAVQTHMTNTRNTPIEVIEAGYPVRVRRYCLRRGSGGAGRHRGGDGVVREFEFLAPASVTLLTERRARGPWGLCDGGPGQAGRNRLNGRPLPAKVQVAVTAGDTLTVETPGGGGYGPADTTAP